jgi:hypothetical protein
MTEGREGERGRERGRGGREEVHPSRPLREQTNSSFFQSSKLMLIVDKTEAGRHAAGRARAKQ